MTQKKRDPKYSSVKTGILQYIQAHGLGPGDQIPSIDEIMELFTVSKVTAVRSVAELENEGYVRRKQGHGTFVASLEGDRDKLNPRRTVAVVVPNTTNPFYGETINTLEQRLREKGFTVELMTTNYLPRRERHLIAECHRARHIAGLIWIDLIDARVFEAEPEALPLVIVGGCPDVLRGRFTTVLCDNRRGGGEAARHLIGLGHRRIGYLQLDIGTGERLIGFKKGLSDAGIELTDASIYIVALNKQLSEDLLEFIRAGRLTALACINDLLAMQAMQILRRNGVRVPEDVSIIGYDNIEPARFLDIPLTTIEQHEAEIGEHAVEVFLTTMESGGRRAGFPREIVYVPKLVVRASTAPPPSH